MRTFKDSESRVWNVRIDVDAVRRVRAALQVDLLDVLGERSLIDRFYSDPVLLCDVLYAVCQQQAEQLGVSSGDFGRMLYGDLLGQATEALLEAIVDFFQTQTTRDNLRKALELRKRIVAGVHATAAAKLESVDVEQAVAEMMANLNVQFPAPGAPPATSGASSGGLPESSASIPAP